MRGGNESQGGGGVFASPAPLTLANVVIRRNQAGGDGGGLRSVSENLTLRRVTLAA